MRRMALMFDSCWWIPEGEGDGDTHALVAYLDKPGLLPEGTIYLEPINGNGQQISLTIEGWRAINKFIEEKISEEEKKDATSNSTREKIEPDSLTYLSKADGKPAYNIRTTE